MIKVTKKDLLNHLSYKWLIYVMTAVLVLFFWNQAFSFYYGIKNDERVSVYIGAADVSNELRSYLKSGVSDEKLREIKVNSDNETDDDFYLKLNTRGLVNTDILILSQSVVDNIEILYLFTPLDKDYLNDYFDVDKYEYLYQNEICIGIVVKNSAISLLDDYITYRDDVYYVFVNRKSVNSGDLNQKNSNLALKVLTNLLKME